MAVPQLQQAITLGGNTPAEKMITGILLAKIRNIMYNETATMAFRSTMTAENITVISGVGLAIYQIAQRLVWGSVYDNNLGAPDQTTSGLTTGVNLDQYLAIKWHVEEFDTERLLKGSPAQLATFMANWAESMTVNLLVNLEAIFIRGVYDYCVAKMTNSVLPTVLKMDLSTPGVVDYTTQEANFYKINELMIKYQQYINLSVFGTNQRQWETVFGLQAYACLSQAYLKIINIVSADTLATGQLYKSEILGTRVATNFYLQQAPFIHGTPRQINQDIDFDFSKLQGIGVHQATWAMPISFQSIRQVFNPNTGNLQWNGKAMFSCPEALYQLCFVILKEYPTSAEIIAAQGRVHPSTGTTDQSQNLKYSFQLASYDTLEAPAALSTKATVLTLGNITTGGTAPTADEVKAAFITANPTVNPEFVSVGTPTTTGATINGSSIYTGSVNVTFTVSTVTVTTKEPAPNDVATLTKALIESNNNLVSAMLDKKGKG